MRRPAAPGAILLTEVKASGAREWISRITATSRAARRDARDDAITVGNTHMRLVPARYDLSAALKILREEFHYQGIYLVEQGIPAAADPYTSIQEVRDYVLEHM